MDRVAPPGAPARGADTALSPARGTGTGLARPPLQVADGHGLDLVGRVEAEDAAVEVQLRLQRAADGGLAISRTRRGRWARRPTPGASAAGGRRARAGAGARRTAPRPAR